MSAHTPGPWIFAEPSGAGLQISAPYKGSTRLLFSDIWRQFPEPVWDQEMRANAKLAATAPDLLAALQSCYDLIAEEVAGGEYTEQAKQARAAINKATGAA